MDMTKLRFVLAVTALAALVALAILVLFFGHDLSNVQVGVLTLLAGAVVAEAKSSSAFIFDGVPEKAPPPPSDRAPAAEQPVTAAVPTPSEPPA